MLNRVDVHKAYGTDNLSPHILKQCVSIISLVTVAIVFTLSMKTGKGISQWKASNIVPVFLKRNKSNIKNYSPVSRPSSVSKIMETSIFNNNYLPIVERSPTKAHVFMRRKSCTTQQLDRVCIIQ